MDKLTSKTIGKGFKIFSSAVIAASLLSGMVGGVQKAAAAEDDVQAKLLAFENEAWQARLFQLDDKISIGKSVANIPNTEIKVGDDMYLGGFSSLTHVPGDPANVFYTSTDRGPNGDIDGTKCSGCKVFPIPQFTPRILKIELSNGSVNVLQQIPLKLPNDQLDPITGTSLISGVSNFPDSVKTNLVGNGVPDEVPVGAVQYNEDGSIKSFEQLATDPYALDLEGIAYNPVDRTFWMGEEYRPSLVQVKMDGTLVQRLVPQDEVDLFANAPAVPVHGAIPAVFSTRNPNRGFESATITPDGKYLFTAIQSPMINPIGTKPNAKSRAARVLKFDLTTQGTPTVVGEYLYVLDGVNGVSNYTSDLMAKDENTLLVDERDANYEYKKIYQIDLTEATNILGQLDNVGAKPTAQAPEVANSTLENTVLDTQSATYTVTPAGGEAVTVTPALKSLVLDTKTRGFMNSKPEGIFMPNDHTLVVVNDNDFSVQDPDPEQAWMYTLNIPSTNASTVVSKTVTVTAKVTSGTSGSKNVALTTKLNEEAMLGTALIQLPDELAAATTDTVSFNNGTARNLRANELKENGRYVLLDGVALKAGEKIQLNLLGKTVTSSSAVSVHVDSDGPEAVKSASAGKMYTVDYVGQVSNPGTTTPDPTTSDPATTPDQAPTQTPDQTPTTDEATKPAPGKTVFNDKVNGDAVKDRVTKAIETAPSEPFKDVKDSHWVPNAIDLAAKIGFVTGYQDGSFHPESKITRAEFATMLVKAMGLESRADSPFTDSKSHWAENAINALKANGIVNGYGDGSFKPDQDISRAEIVTMLAKFMDLSQVSTTAKFNDVNSKWAQNDINALANAGIVSGKSDDKFDPNAQSSRVEAVTMILRMLNVNLNLGLKL